MSECAFFIDEQSVVRHVALDLAGAQIDGESADDYEARRKALIPTSVNYFIADFSARPTDEAEALTWAQQNVMTQGPP